MGNDLQELLTLVEAWQRGPYNMTATEHGLHCFDLTALRSRLKDYAWLMRQFDGYLEPFGGACEQLYAAADALDPKP